MAKGQFKQVGGYLVAIGGILAVVFAILGIFSFVPVSTLGLLQPPLILILRMLVGLIILATSGVLNIEVLKMERSGIILLILGIILWPIGDPVSSIVTIVGAILMMI
ncbi:MAG: hypothetical protein ACW97G_15970 [Candidatus Thorarchaeota archaeon]